MQVRAVKDPAERSQHCRALTALLPGWFALPEANEHYATGIAGLDCFGAFDATGTCRGLVALKPHFADALEVWWLAVDPGWHGRGVGTALMAAADGAARDLGRGDLIVMTLSPESDDSGYAATRAFYEARGFRPLIAMEHGPEDDPLMWMIRKLS